METLLLALLEAAKRNPKQLNALKVIAVELRQYELLRLLDIEREINTIQLPWEGADWDSR